MVAEPHIQSTQFANFGTKAHTLTPEDRERARQARAHSQARTKAARIARMQDVAEEIALDAKHDAQERLSAMKTFETLEERLRILSMKPLPGSLKPEATRKAHKSLARSTLADLVTPTQCESPS